jgi:uncharacterized protein
MILYLDTSALVKRYFHETCSDEIISRWNTADHIVTSVVAYAETMASFYRKKRDVNLTGKLMTRTVELFHRDWESFIRVEINNELNGHIDRVIRRYPLRGYDAIHLASALVVRESVPDDFLFACLDDRLTAAARSEGLTTFPAAF